MSTTIRDSAGVTIIENTGPSTPTELLSVAAEPFLDLAREDDEHYQFYGAFGGLRLADGTYVIANTADRTIRYYSPDGEWLRSFGRRGGGPCEFALNGALYRLSDDTLAVWDSGTNFRLSVFTTAGECVSMHRTVTEGHWWRPRILGVLEDGSLVASVSVPVRPPTRQGIVRDSVWALRMDRELEVTTEIGPFPGFARYVHEDGEAPRYTPLFHTATRIIPAGAYFAVADNRSYEIDFYSTAGDIVRSMRRVVERRPVTDRDLRRARQDRRERGADAVVGQEMHVIDELPAGVSEFPYLSDLKVDLLGYLWVRLFEAPGVAEPWWEVFDPSGILLGRVRLPGDINVLEIGEDYLLGVVRDEEDVEHPVVYAVSRDG